VVVLVDDASTLNVQKALIGYAGKPVIAVPRINGTPVGRTSDI